MQQAIINDQINKWFHIADESLAAIKASIGAELELGLRDEEAATIKMLITYVRELSRGDEIGSYLALDLGGTHFRVLLVQLNGEANGEPKVTSVTHDIPHELLITENGQQLFDYIALRLLDFVQDYKLKRRRISLGFTFSFPCKQYGLTQSYLVKWCKGFKVGGVINTDVVRQLKDALKRQLAGRLQAYIDVVAVLNDTTGTLVACANKNRDCAIGLIVGTGYNACYIERLDRCDKWPANYTSPKQVIINCEWGAMGDNRQRRELDQFRNELDHEIDSSSVNPLSQTYEKMVGGMYVGEMLRLAMLSLYKRRILFQSGPRAGAGQGSLRSSSSSSSPSSSSATSPALRSRAQPNGRDERDSRPKSDSGPAKPGPRLALRAQTPRSPIEGRQQATGTGSGGRAQSGRRPSSGSRSSRRRESSDTTRRRDPVLAGPAAAGAQTATAAPKAANGQHKLHVKGILDGKHLSLLAQDELAGTYNETAKIFKELNISHYSELDLEAAVKVGAAIMRRAAHLVASGISALLERMQRPFTVIGYDGSLIKYHPYFLRLLIDKTAQLTRQQYKFQFVQSSDGSGIGAAVVAAALHKERRPLYVVKPGKLYEMHFLRTQMMQSQLSLDGNVAQHQQQQPPLPGLERVGSVSSRASNVTSSPAASQP